MRKASSSAVFMIGMEEMIFPHARSIEEQGIEEERRLAYVGMTRAQERLTLLHASTRSLWGSRSYNLPSRFLDELPEQGVERERLSPASWDYGRKTAPEYAPRTDIPALSTGDSVRHQTLGEGVVVGMEAGGVVTVRFAGTTVVGVAPTHRRRGVLRAMMRAHLDDAHRRGEQIAALWASEETIYGRFGYGAAALAGEVKIPRERVAFASPYERLGTVRLV